MNFLILLAGSASVIAFISHAVSIFAVIARLKRQPATAAAETSEGTSILRPVCGIENFIEETLQSTFTLNHPRYEILFCVAASADSAIPSVRRLIAEHPEVDANPF